ncbi:Ger(x)C family spore germination protein [Cohnella lubricantis]|uniref:Ger(X)C family spore germination protein n=2 Tax=Cohnella lubricantis TaxID=2163172 RepID=A0A841T975_9BACL|nr:Ger(x)C family spore germination protein [Cohnella lubricantis]
MVLTLPILTGCWDRLEIEDRAVVLGVSIDKAPPESANQETEVAHVEGANPIPPEDMIRVAVQIAIPGRIPLGPGESGGGGGGGGGKSSAANTVWVLHVVGHSIDDALMNLQQQVASSLFFGHLRVIVISEEVAKKGLENINDYFRRNSEVRRMAWILVAKGEAMQFLTAAPKLERVPTLYLLSTLEEGFRMGKFPQDFIGMFWSNSSKKGQEGFLPYVELKKENNVEIAYFKGPKMVGSTSPLEIGAYMAIKGINPAGYRVIVQLNGAADTVITAATHRKARYSVRIAEGRPHFTIHIAFEQNVEEKYSEHIGIDNQEILSNIEKKQAQVAVEYFEQFIRKTQEAHSDIFGFGEYIRAKRPAFWNRNVKTKEKWQEMYKDAEFDVTVTMKIRRVGMKAR